NSGKPVLSGQCKMQARLQLKNPMYRPKRKPASQGHIRVHGKNFFLCHRQKFTSLPPNRHPIKFTTRGQFRNPKGPIKGNVKTNLPPRLDAGPFFVSAFSPTV